MPLTAPLNAFQKYTSSKILTTSLLGPAIIIPFKYELVSISLSIPITYSHCGSELDDERAFVSYLIAEQGSVSMQLPIPILKKKKRKPFSNYNRKLHFNYLLVKGDLNGDWAFLVSPKTQKKKIFFSFPNDKICFFIGSV